MKHLHSQQKGFSLLELMIALAIGILLLASVLMVIVNATRSGRVSDAETAMNEEGMITLNLLQQQIRLAGYSATVSETGTVTKNFTNQVSVRGCDTGFADSRVRFDDLACAASGTSAAIAVRYEADILNTLPVGTPIPDKPSNCLFNAIATNTVSDVTGAANYALADNRFYINTSAKSGRPELVCTGSNSGDSATPATSVYIGAQPLIENVEQLRFMYGVTRSDDPEDLQITTYQTAAQIGEPTSATDMRWRRVASVKICVLMRSAEPTRDGTNQSYRDCWGAVQQSADGYLRRAYITTAQLRNKASVPLEKL